MDLLFQVFVHNEISFYSFFFLFIWHVEKYLNLEYCKNLQVVHSSMEVPWNQSIADQEGQW